MKVNVENNTQLNNTGPCHSHTCFQHINKESRGKNCNNNIVSSHWFFSQTSPLFAWGLARSPSPHSLGLGGRLPGTFTTWERKTKADVGYEITSCSGSEYSHDGALRGCLHSGLQAPDTIGTAQSMFVGWRQALYYRNVCSPSLTLQVELS